MTLLKTLNRQKVGSSQVARCGLQWLCALNLGKTLSLVVALFFFLVDPRKIWKYIAYGGVKAQSPDDHLFFLVQARLPFFMCPRAFHTFPSRSSSTNSTTNCTWGVESSLFVSSTSSTKGLFQVWSLCTRREPGVRVSLNAPLLLPCSKYMSDVSQHKLVLDHFGNVAWSLRQALLGRDRET